LRIGCSGEDMSNRHIVDPELLATLDAYPGFSFALERLPQIREQFMQREIKDDPQVEVIEHLVPGPPGSPKVRVVLYAPRSGRGASPALLSDAQSKLLANQLGCVVASVDYRLAPETPFPGAVEDCHAALTWLRAEARALGVDADRIAVGGESAGGGLAAALTLYNRDRDAVPIVLQYLTYPMLDHRTGAAADAHIYEGVATWTGKSNRFGWASLLGHDDERAEVSPYASPSRAASLAGLPPTFIGVGAIDLFAEESLEYARRLIRDGVPTELHVYPGAFHGFNQVAAADVTQRFQRDQFAALRRAFQLRQETTP
jgi:acetyl esterase/lipase